MTDPNSDVAAVVAERFGIDIDPLPDRPDALPVRDPGRTRQLAALHSVAGWFADNPDMPAPTYVQMHVEVPTRAELDALADWFDGTIYGSRPQFHLELGPPGGPAIILYVVQGGPGHEL